MAHRSNFYAGLCSVCGTNVAANAGVAEAPPPGARSNRWIVKCKKCAGVVENSKPRISATQEGANVVFKPTDFLGGDLFSAYRQATHGAKYDGIRRVQVAPIEKAISMTKALHDAGFVVDLSAGLSASLQAKAAEIREGVVQAATRASKVDEELQKRGLTLFPFQRVGVQWLASRSGALLADDMGLGKTIQALIALPEGQPVLVVGPAVAKNVWEQEAKKWRPDLKVTVLSGRNSFRFPEPGEMVITNYDILSADPGVPNAGTVVVADEAHVLKSIKASRTKKFRTISEAVRKDNGKVWLMTATPLMNRPPELWSVLQAAGIAHEAFGSWSNFVRLFNAVEGEWGGYEWGSPSPEVPSLLQRVSLRRMKVDVLPDLPTKMYRDVVVDIELDARTKKAAGKLASMLETFTRFSRINEEPTPTEMAAADLAAEKAAFEAKFGQYAAYIDDAEQLLKKVSGLDFEEISKARAALATAKIPALLALVEDYEEQEEPIVVFSAHRAPIDVFIGREGWEVITGDTSPADRLRIQNLFQEGKLKGIAGTIKAAGVSLTLTRSSNVIFVDLEWSPSLNSQAEDRCLRIGTTRGVLITTLVANFPLDKRVHELLTIKRSIIKGSVEASARTSSPEIALPEIGDDDLAAITRAADEERAKEAAAQKEAEDRAKDFAGKQKEIEEKNEEERKRQKKQARLDRWLDEAKRDEAPRRFAQTAREHWIVEGLQTLAQLDPDRAAVKNDVGFSASDGGVGHRLAYLAPNVGLTEQQWGLAYILCRKYHRQIGGCPEE